MTSLFSKSQWTYEKENQVHAVLPCFQVRGIFSRFVNVPSWSDRGFKKLYILTLLSRPGTVIDRFLLVSGTDLFFSLFFIYFAPSFVLDVHRLSTLTNNNGRSWRGAAAVSSLSLFFFFFFSSPSLFHFAQLRKRNESSSSLAGSEVAVFTTFRRVPRFYRPCSVFIVRRDGSRCFFFSSQETDRRSATPRDWRWFSVRWFAQNDVILHLKPMGIRESGSSPRRASTSWGSTEYFLDTIDSILDGTRAFSWQK